MPGLSARKRIFLSFQAEDKEQVAGLRLLASNPGFDLEFYDESVRVPVDSDKAEYVKRVIREKIARTSVTVCLIGEMTYTSRWVDWELEESEKKRNTIIAMALKGIERATLPTLIARTKLSFYAWDPTYLARLISEAP